MGTLTAAIDPARLAEARAEGYALLAELIERGVTPATLELATASPRIAPLISTERMESLAADHCHVFELSVPPYEGLLMDPDGCAGSRAQLGARATLHEIGVAMEPGSEPEHLATQLRGLARATAAQCAPVQLARLLDHLLRWVVPYEAAIVRCGRPFPIAILAELVELMLHHRAELEVTSVVADDPTRGALALELDHPDTDLRAIATFLALPAASGLVITRDDVTRVSRRTRVPRGFGSRSLMLLNLLRAGAELGLLDEITAELDTIACAHRQHLLDRLGQSGHIVELWQRKLDRTRAVLARLGESSVVSRQSSVLDPQPSTLHDLTAGNNSPVTSRPRT